MTELQKVFLFYVFLYFLAKGGLYVGLYLALVIVEKHARIRHEKLLALYMKRRADENERWKVAYSIYDKRRLAEQALGSEPKSVKVPSTMVKLIHAPARPSTNEFTRYRERHSSSRIVS